ncbi:hypothetical protein BJV77DRAFT_1010015 [Russula vinacea]|nr:hypothetical protein BJV77DRAFT_1010015 [Russula vinacea]
MALSRDMSALIAMVCEAFLYGSYTILFAFSIYLKLNSSHRWNAANSPIFILGVLLFLACTTHFILEFNHFYHALNTTGVKGFGNQKNGLVGAVLLIAITDFLGELVLIYRCWMLWSKNYVIIFLPTLSAIAGLACLSEVVAQVNSTTPVVPAFLVPLGLAAYTLPLCTNVIVTALIAGRIWYMMREIRDADMPTKTGRAAIDIIVESGMLYLAIQLVYVTLFALRLPAQTIASHMAVQIYGIAPTLIIIRVSLGMSSMPSGPVISEATSTPRHISTRLHFAHSTATSTDASANLHVTTEVPMSGIKMKHSGGDLGSSFSSVENTTTV